MNAEVIARRLPRAGDVLQGDDGVIYFAIGESDRGLVLIWLDPRHKHQYTWLRGWRPSDPWNVIYEKENT